MITYHGGICNNNTKIKVSQAKLGNIDGNTIPPLTRLLYNFAPNLSDEIFA